MKAGPTNNQEDFSYRPRNPSESLLYKTIQENLETFLQTLHQDPSAKGFPEYVVGEFREFLRCGILAHGFLRYRCDSCAKELLVGFSCKNRGFCPSCLARRMNEMAAFLTDHVLPDENIRQWVVSLPIPLRYWCASNTKLTARINKIAVNEINRYYFSKAKALGYNKKELHTGLITFVQRFGSSLNLNVHFHILALDGVYLDRSDRKLSPEFISIKSPSETDLEVVVKKIAMKSVRALRKLGYLDDATEEVLATGLDPLFIDEPEHALAMAASVKQRIAFGDRRGQKVRTIKHYIHRAFGYEEDEVITKGTRCVAVNGFSLHAATRIKKGRRQALEQLIRYAARGPFSHKRLTIESDGDLRYTLKTPWNDGTVAIKLSPEELIEKLAALVPIPRFNLFRYSGVFAPNHNLRSQIVPSPKIKPASCVEDALPQAIRYKWHELLKRIFDIDINNCPACGGKDTMKFVAVIQDSLVVEKFLGHLGYPARPPPITPARYKMTELMDFA